MAKVLLMSLGSRGDMEPFLAKAEELQAQGDTVALCMPAQFESLAREVSDLWHPQDISFLELLESPDVQNITGQIGSPLSRLRTMLRLMRKTKGIQPQLIVPHIADQFFWARRIVASGLGPAGFPIKALTKERLQRALENLL